MMETQTIELDVLGMTCASCANTVERTLARTRGRRGGAREHRDRARLGDL